MEPYQLPGANLFQVNDSSSDGLCLFSAVGNVLLHVLSHTDILILFGRARPRNLQDQVACWIIDTLNEENVQVSLNANPGFWQSEKHGICTINDYQQKKIKGTRIAWGSTFDIHIIAYYLAKKGLHHRIVVHTKNTNMFSVHHPLVPTNAAAPSAVLLPVTNITASQLTDDDIVLINNANMHWTRAQPV